MLGMGAGSLATTSPSLHWHWGHGDGNSGAVSGHFWASQRILPRVSQRRGSGDLRGKGKKIDLKSMGRFLQPKECEKPLAVC